MEPTYAPGTGGSNTKRVDSFAVTRRSREAANAPPWYRSAETVPLRDAVASISIVSKRPGQGDPNIDRSARHGDWIGCGRARPVPCEELVPPRVAAQGEERVLRDQGGDREPDRETTRVPRPDPIHGAWVVPGIVREHRRINPGPEAIRKAGEPWVPDVPHVARKVGERELLVALVDLREAAGRDHLVLEGRG